GRRWRRAVSEAAAAVTVAAEAVRTVAEHDVEVPVLIDVDDGRGNRATLHPDRLAGAELAVGRRGEEHHRLRRPRPGNEQVALPVLIDVGDGEGARRVGDRELSDVARRAVAVVVED